MKILFKVFVVILLTCCYSYAQNNWPTWRGPNLTGAILEADPPIEWSETKNIKWKIEIPGKGHSTPIVWGNKLFVLTAIDTKVKGKNSKEKDNGGHAWMSKQKSSNIFKFVVIALNRLTGEKLWERSAVEEVPKEGTHGLGSWASNSPVTDGEYVYAYFGSRGLFCYDFNGNLKWKRDFGQMEKRMEFGEGASPAIYKDKIFIQWDHNGDSFLFAIDKKTGKDAWKVKRDEITSWSTPIVVESGETAQVITSATNAIRSYSADSGKLIWECQGMTKNVIPQPLYKDGILYFFSGFRGHSILAVQLDAAKGNITDGKAVIWSRGTDAPYTPSAIVMNNRLYFLKTNKGMLTCVNAKSGEEYYKIKRLEKVRDVFASPIGAGNRLYIPGKGGNFAVVKDGPKFELLAANKLDDEFHASPVVIGNSMYLRGFKYLYCISEN